MTGVDRAKQAIIEGVVVRSGQPVANAYVRLLDRSGEFTAEVPTSATGGFRFFARPGQWGLRTLAPGSAVADRSVWATTGSVAEVVVELRDEALPA